MLLLLAGMLVVTVVVVTPPLVVVVIVVDPELTVAASPGSITVLFATALEVRCGQLSRLCPTRSHHEQRASQILVVLTKPRGGSGMYGVTVDRMAARLGICEYGNRDHVSAMGNAGVRATRGTMYQDIVQRGGCVDGRDLSVLVFAKFALIKI
jgi:hypothetical protein